MIPRIEFNNLIVDDKVFPILGGELLNSSASDLSYMNEHVWPYLQNLSLNTVLLPMSWELIEPSEDFFDFSLLEGLINQARFYTGGSL